MPNDRQQEQKRRDKAAKHIRSVLAQTLTTFIQLLTFTFELFWYLHGIV
jgi:hypothetical protein